jgi:3-(3-hydroxy-phenyl)propionate hydroxylase
MLAERSEFDVVIVGLGPVGAVAANIAGLLGLETLVLERTDHAYLKPRAIVFDAEVMRIFASIGLAERIAKASRALGGSIYLGADRHPIRTFRARQPAHAKAWSPSNLFYQPELESLLREGLNRFSNVTVLLKHELAALRDFGSGSTLNVIAHGSSQSLEIRARFVLACDGASSTVRKLLQIPLDDIGFEERWLVVDTFVSGPMRWPSTHAIPEEVQRGEYSLMLCDPARPSTLIPGVGRHRRWEYMLLPGERDDDVVGSDWLRQQLSQWIDPQDVEIVRSAVYHFRALIAQRWRINNVFLVGDAAHQTPPFYGQGMCHGIRDAAQLMWKLELVLSDISTDPLLDSYQVEREPHVREIVSASVSAGAQVCILDPEAAMTRDKEFRRIEFERRSGPAAITDVVPPIRAGIIDSNSGGMRLPELAVETDDGRTLDDLLAGRFTLLTRFEEADHLPAELAAGWGRIAGQTLRVGAPGDSECSVLDASGDVSNWLAQRQAYCAIVRPDRYVYAMPSDRESLYEHISILLETLLLSKASNEGVQRI